MSEKFCWIVIFVGIKSINIVCRNIVLMSWWGIFVYIVIVEFIFIEFFVVKVYCVIEIWSIWLFFCV